VNNCIVHPKVGHLDQVLHSISKRNSCHHQVLVLDLDLLIGCDLGLENEQEDWLSGIAKRVVELCQFSIL